PMNEFLLVHRSQTGSDLRQDFQRQLCLELAGAFNETLQRFPLYELQRVKVIPAGSAQMEDRGNVRVTNARRCACFTQKTKSRRFIADIFFVNELQGHRTPEMNIERLVGYTHRTPAQFDGFPVFALHQLVVVKALGWLYGLQLECIRSRRFAGLGSPAKSLAEHTDRAELHRSRKL